MLSCHHSFSFDMRILLENSILSSERKTHLGKKLQKTKNKKMCQRTKKMWKIALQIEREWRMWKNEGAIFISEFLCHCKNYMNSAIKYKDSQDFSFLHSSLFSTTSSCRQKCCKHMFCKLSESWISSSLFDWWLIFGEFSKRSKKKWGLIVSSTKSFKITVEKLYELAIVFCDCFIVVWADLNKQALVTHSHHTTVKGRGIKSGDKVMQ